MTTKGKFQDAIFCFRSILLSIPLLVLNSPTEESEARNLIEVCKEYIIGLSMEVYRKTLSKETLTEQASFTLLFFLYLCSSWIKRSFYLVSVELYAHI